MKLNELLHKKILKGKNIKIGSKGGVSFFYADRVGSQTNKDLKEINEMYKNKIIEEINELEGYMANFDTYWANRVEMAKKVADAEWVKHTLEKTQPKDRKAKKKELEQKKKNLESYLNVLEKTKNFYKVSYPKRIAKLKKQLNSYMPLWERTVVEIYPSINTDELDTVIILIRGFEKGDYWTITEYQDRYLPDEQKRRVGWHYSTIEEEIECERLCEELKTIANCK